MNNTLGRTKSIAMAAAVALLVTPLALAGDARIQVGDKMPGFTMKDYEGNKHSLADYQEKLVVFDFSSHNCPYSRGADPHISKIAKEYSEKGVVFLGVDSDRTNDAKNIKEYAKEAGVPFPILIDKENVYADAVHATRTPEIYIVQNGILKYHGAFDNRSVPAAEGDVNYVTQALDELLAGKEVSTPKVAAWGCTIKRVAKKAD